MHSQVVVVLSGSMEPGFYRGDILFLYMGRRPLQSGEVRPADRCVACGPSTSLVMPHRRSLPHLQRPFRWLFVR